MLLTGQKSYMNDQSIFPFIQQLTQGSLRSFQSMPNGNLFIFFPDYFGGFGARVPYFNITDLEILDGKIYLTDEALATHVYVTGDTIEPNANTVTILDQMASTGVVTVENAGIANFINHNTEQTINGSQAPFLDSPQDVIAFLQRYGIRPLVNDMPMIRSHYFELFVAFQIFMLMWARQYETTFTFTFMPELYPGGIVAFPQHEIAMFIQDVYHTFDYQQGFTTTATLMAPAAYNPSNKDITPYTEGLVVQGSVLGVPNPGGVGTGT
jgi:hypothetical protein